MQEDWAGWLLTISNNIHLDSKTCYLLYSDFQLISEIDRCLADPGKTGQ